MGSQSLHLVEYIWKKMFAEKVNMNLKKKNHVESVFHVPEDDDPI